MKIYRAEDYFKDELEIYFSKHHIAPNHTTGLHMHEFAELVYIYSGCGTHSVDAHSYPVEKGCVIFINYGHSHDYVSESGMDIMNIMLSPSFISRELVNSENFMDIMALSQFEDMHNFSDAEPECTRFTGQDMLDAERICDAMLREWRERRVGYKTILKGYVQIFLAMLMRSYGGSGASDARRIPPDIISYINKNCFEKLTVNELAERSFYNPAYFGRLFKEYCGKSFKSYVTGKRMDEAIRLLGSSDMSIDDICAEVGYTNRSQFYRHFLEHTGKTPADVRKELGQS